MKEFFQVKYELEHIEQQMVVLREREKKRHEELIIIGRSYFTDDVRKKIIEQVNQDVNKNWVVQDLEECHAKWQGGNVTYSDVLLFASHDTHMIETEQRDYSDTKVHKIFKFLFGGDES